MPCGRARHESVQRVVIRPTTSAAAAAMPLGWAERCRQNDIPTRTSWNMAAEMLAVLSFSGASCSRFDHRGGGDDAACADRFPRSTNILVGLRAPAASAAAGGGAFEVDG